MRPDDKHYDPLRRGVDFDIHLKAKEMMAAGYSGQNVDSPDAKATIYLAATNPDFERHMSPGAYGFWWLLNHKFKVFLAKRALGVE